MIGHSFTEVRRHAADGLLRTPRMGDGGHRVPGRLVTRTSWVRDKDTKPVSADITALDHEFEYTFNMHLRYNYRLYPWPRHRAALAKVFGCARVVFNDALRAREAAYQAGEP